MIVLTAAGALALWRSPQSLPDLEVVCALARKHEFNQAEELLARYLRALPGDQRGHLLMAQFALDRPDPKPQTALDHLVQIHTRSPREAAVVRFTEGKAYYQQKHYELAEECWRDALQLDPSVPEAGWALLDLLDFEGRQPDAHRLGMQLYEHEPDLRDQVRLLLEMTRIDIDKVAPGSQVQVFEPLWREHPDNLALGAAVGLALIHDSQAEQGLEILRTVLDHHPDSAHAWDSWFTGLDDGFRPDLLQQEFKRLPASLRDDPRFAKHEGTVAQGLRDWPRAIAAYRRAVAFEPYNGVVLYRLRMALRALGENDEFRKVDAALTTFQNAFKAMRGVYTKVKQTRTLGIEPHPELYQEIANLREQLGRHDEAREWHRLVLRDDPANALSLAALARLK